MEQMQIPPLRLLVRLGPTAIWTLITGFVLILLAWLFLSFLWFSDESSPQWLQIVEAGWVIRSVTIAAFVIRWAVSAQAVFCVSMLAAIVLERAEAPLALAPSISMITVNGMGLLQFLSVCVRIPKAKMVAATAISMALASGLLQFTSTALLSDLGTSFVATNTTSDVAFTMSTKQSTMVDINGRYLYRQPSFPAFAELSLPTAAKVPAGVVDTGPTLRAFLPIPDSAERVLTLEYSGPAHVFDTRVVCSRPPMQGIEFVSNEFLVMGLQGELRTPDVDIDRFTRPVGQQGRSVPFLCSVPFMGSDAEPAQTAYLPISICPTTVDFEMGSLRSVMREYREDDEVELPHMSFLILSTQGPTEKWTGWHDWVDQVIRPGPPEVVGTEDMGPDSPWTRIDTEWKNASVMVTQCFATLDSQVASIRAWRTRRNGTEPSSRTTKDFDTTEIRRQLGVNGTSTPVDRGIFQLEDKQSWVAYDKDGDYVPSIGTKKDVNVAMLLNEYLYLVAQNFTDPNQVSSIKIGYSDQVSLKDVALGGAQGRIVSDTFQTTSNPALAVQAFLTMQLSLAYYEYSEYFDVVLPATSLVDRAVLHPVQKTFYFVILGGVGVHVLLVVAVTVAFAIGTKWTTRGSAWQSFAHLSSQDIHSCVAGKANVVNDAEVVKKIRSAGLQSTLVGTIESQGRIQVVRRR